jgi:DNA invertase Pin-like site-specific DNA recombinase
MTTNRPLVSYLRQSRARERTISIEEQRRDIQAWARAQGVELAPEVVEQNVSGSKPWRDRALGEAVAACEAGEAAGIVVAWQDRLSRENGRATAEVWEALEQADARLVCAAEGLDTATGDHEMLFSIKAAVAREQWKRHRANWERARRNAIDRGVLAGRGGGLGRRSASEGQPGGGRSARLDFRRSAGRMCLPGGRSSVRHEARPVSRHAGETEVREMRIVLRVVSVLVLAGLVWAGVAVGAPPTIERINVDETFADEFLTEACGVPVTVSARGHVIFRTFSDGGVVEVDTFAIRVTATAGDRTFRFNDVGADHLQTKPDGTVILSISGQVPFAFAGVLKINPETEEVILEPRDRSEEQLAKACRALTGG